jgi:hypothetical protein
MTVPEILLTHRNPRTESLVRKRLVAPLSTTHHAAEPRNTPRTSNIAERALPLASPATPRPANIAAKERIVVGFVSVRKNVEA